MSTAAQETALPDTLIIVAPTFDNDSSNYSSSGSIKLSWHSQAPDRDTAIASFELERATNREFTDALMDYRGPDLATYISGLSEGLYYFRVREVRNGVELSGWSSPVMVEVEHHSLDLAFTLFGIGGVVFALTVFVVVRGAARTKDPDKPANSSNQQPGS